MLTAKEIHAPSNIGMNNLPRIVGTHKNGKDKWLTKHGLVFGDPYKEDRKMIRRQLGGGRNSGNENNRIEAKTPNRFQRGVNKITNFFRNQNR